MWCYFGKGAEDEEAAVHEGMRHDEADGAAVVVGESVVGHEVAIEDDVDVDSAVGIVFVVAFLCAPQEAFYALCEV